MRVNALVSIGPQDAESVRVLDRQAVVECTPVVESIIRSRSRDTRHIEQLIQYPGAFQVLDFADGRVRLVGARAHRDGPLVGQEIRTLHGMVKELTTLRVPRRKQ